MGKYYGFCFTDIKLQPLAGNLPYKPHFKRRKNRIKWQFDLTLEGE
jgi:hypothetical protein